MKPIGISQARARFFDLVDEVLETDRVVWIEHRDRDSRVALVSEERLRQLEASAGAIPKPVRPGIKLAGSMRLGPGETDSDRILEDLRRETASRFQARLSELERT